MSSLGVREACRIFSVFGIWFLELVRRSFSKIEPTSPRRTSAGSTPVRITFSRDFLNRAVRSVRQVILGDQHIHPPRSMPVSNLAASLTSMVVPPIDERPPRRVFSSLDGNEPFSPYDPRLVDSAPHAAHLQRRDSTREINSDSSSAHSQQRAHDYQRAVSWNEGSCLVEIG